MLIPLEKLSRKEMLRRGGGNLNEIIEFKRDENASIFQWHLTTTWRRSTLNCIRQVRVSRFCNRSARREFHSHYVWLLMCLESRASGTAAKVKTHKCLLREEEIKLFHRDSSLPSISKTSLREVLFAPLKPMSRNETQKELESMLQIYRCCFESCRVSRGNKFLSFRV